MIKLSKKDNSLIGGNGFATYNPESGWTTQLKDQKIITLTKEGLEQQAKELRKPIIHFCGTVLFMLGFIFIRIQFHDHETKYWTAKTITEIVTEPYFNKAQERLSMDLDYKHPTIKTLQRDVRGNPTLNQVNGHIVYETTLDKNDCNDLKEGFNKNEYLLDNVNLIINSKVFNSTSELQSYSCNIENNWKISSKIDV
jgi:hypothetical protein